MKRFFSLLILPLVFSFSVCFVLAKTLIPGGESIGIVMSYPGVVVTGSYPFLYEGQEISPNEGKIQIGDLIQSVEGKRILCNDDLITIIRENLPEKSILDIELLRDGKSLQEKLSIYYDADDDSFKTGLYIKDQISGIGTITFYDPETKTYGALGHPLMDDELESSLHLEVNSSETFDAYILSVKKSQDGQPGQKMARIEKTKHLGDVQINDRFGVYGFYDTLYKEDMKAVEVASQKEIHLGTATILTVLEGHKCDAFEIEIVHLEKQTEEDIKGIQFKVVDERLLQQTNGVIQGMSGSPIIQDGKIIGAVTHVSIDDVKSGYGLYIEWMLEENKKMIR